MWYDVGGAVSLLVDSTAEHRVADFVRGQMKPYLPQPEPQLGDVALVREGARAELPPLLDIENAAGDRLTTAWDGQNALALRCGRRCVVPDAISDRPAVFRYERGFPIWEIWGSMVRPALGLAALRRGAVVVHASAVSIDGKAVLVAGWSESGKTEVALALAETGAAFLSDKWTLVRADGKAAPFPASVGVRRWVLRYLPTLRGQLPVSARAQLAGARMAGLLTSPLRERTSSQVVLREVSAAATRAADLADRVAMPAGEIRRIYGGTGDPSDPVPLSTVVLLTTVQGRGRVSVSPVDAETVARRLARAAAYERRDYFSVGQRVAYAADGHARSGPDEAIETEQRLLVQLLAGVRLVEARTDFPEDPRQLASAIREVVGE
jgi:hypothetical protein